MTGRPALAVVHGADQDQVPRLTAFKAANPHVVVGTLSHGGPWQARIPEDGGETVVTRYLLKDLLDRLAGLVGEPECPPADRGG